MPVYNAQRYVAATVERVLAQTFADFEFVIVTDGSTDGTLEILEGYAATDNRLLIVSRPNTGIVGALNDGLAKAQGTYIARIDADDLCEPQRLAEQVARLDADADLVALGSSATVTDAEGRRLGAYTVPLTHEEIEKAHLAGDSAIHHPAVTMRTEAVRRVGGYRDGYCPAEDFDLWLRLGEVGRLANLPEALITKRLTEDGIVGSSLEKQHTIVSRILAETWTRRGLPGEPPEPRRPNRDRVDMYRQWAWMALRNRETATARRYAWKTLARRPLDKESWRAVFCCCRGY